MTRKLEMFRGIGRMLSVGFLGTSVFPLLIVSLMAYQQGKNTIMTGMIDRYQEDAKSYLGQLDMILAERYINIRSLSENHIISSRESTPQILTQELKSFKQAYPVYSSLSFFDMNRVRIADTEDIQIGEQHRMIGYWSDVLEGKISAGSDVRIAEEIKIPIIYFAAPVKDKEGRAFGVVVARYNPTVIKEMFEHIDPSRKIWITLINKEGYVIFSSDPYYKGRILTEKINQTASVIAAMEGKRGMIEEFHPQDKTNYLTVYDIERGFGAYKGNGWRILISMEMRQVLIPITNLRNRILVVGVIIGILVLFVALSVSRKIVNPIAKLQTAAKEIGKGQLDYPIEVTSQDEIGLLAKAFKKMAGDLGVALQKEKELWLFNRICGLKEAAK